MLNIKLGTPHSRNLSNILRLYPVLFAFSEKTVAGNYYWSPTRIIFLGSWQNGIRFVNSID